MRYQYRDREFWCRGFCVDTAGGRIQKNKRIYSKPIGRRPAKLADIYYYKRI